MDFSTFITFLLAIQGLFLTLFLLSHDRGNKKANRWLGIYTGSFSLFVLLIGLEQAALPTYPHLFGLGYPFIFLLGPAFYYFVRNYLKIYSKVPLRVVYHLIPFVLSLLVMLPVWASGADTKLRLFRSIYVQAEPGYLSISWFTECLHVIVYSFAALHLLQRRSGKIIGIQNRKTPKKVFRWLYILAIGNTIVWTGYALVYLNFLVFENIDPNDHINTLFITLSSVFIYLIGYLGWRQPELFSSDELILSKLQANPSKYEHSALTSMEKQAIGNRLKEQMGKDQLFLDPDLTLKDLADSIGISPNHVSQVLNEAMGQNFYDFVNRHRVEEAKIQLADPDKNHLSVLGIAEHSGFRAKSTFNKVFKEMTGVTPSQFRENNLPSMPE